jgi:hypothetical protein
MYDTGLAARIRAKGVTVVEVAGWKTRGNSSGFKPRGAVHHHTAGSARGATPSLNICIYGRSDVPGPLCQVLQSREPDPDDDKAYVIAAGKANHGGVGHWDNPATGERFNSNYESMGLEVEHVGTGAADPARHEISCRILAAFLEAPGSSHDHLMCCEHYEYADPPGRKVDFRELSPPYANRGDGVRGRVKYWIGRTVGDGQGDDDLDSTQNATLNAIKAQTTEILKALRYDPSVAGTEDDVGARIKRIDETLADVYAQTTETLKALRFDPKVANTEDEVGLRIKRIDETVAALLAGGGT